MGISMHVYSDLNEYILRNSDRVDGKRKINESSLKLLDMIVTPDDKILVVLDCEKYFDRPDVSRSIACYQKNNISKYMNGEERLVKYEDVEYNPKNDNITFFPKFIGKSGIFFKIGRFWGDRPEKKTKIDWEYKFYNLSMNKIDLILKKH
jgi:hypothetical protein